MSDTNRIKMLELEDVCLHFRASRKSFDGGVHRVLEGVNLSIYEGETLGIVGRNGVGKTTTLRVMARILAPTSGKITIAPGKAASLLSLGLGFKPELAGRENAYLAAMLQGASRAEAESRLEEIKAFSELGDSFEEPVKTYSAGMNARLGFTTALMTHVDILLIDEVLSVGDAHFRGKALAAMQDRITSDQTVVFVSHMADQVKTLCNRVVWLEEGRVAMEGDAEEVVDAYQNYINRSRREGMLAQRAKDQSFEA